MMARCQSVAGDRMNRSAVLLFEQRYHYIDHCQSAADKQHGGLRVEVSERTRMPRIAIVVSSRIEFPIFDLGVRGRKISQRQNDPVGFNPAPVSKRHNRAPALRSKRDDFAPDRIKASVMRPG